MTTSLSLTVQDAVREAEHAVETAVYMQRQRAKIYLDRSVKILTCFYQLEDQYSKRLESAGCSSVVRIRFCNWVSYCVRQLNIHKSIVETICYDLIDGDFLVMYGPFVQSK